MAGALNIDVTASTAQLQSEMSKAAQVADYEMKRIAKASAVANDAAAQLAKAQRDVGDSAAQIARSAHEMEGFSFKTAGAKRELLVLAHELSQGNYSRLGGSIMVLGERTGAAALLFSGMGLAVLGAGAALAGVVTAVVEGALETDKLNKSLTLTGNFAGQTAGSFDALAHATSAATGQSLGKTRDALQALVATGQFGPKVLGQMANAVSMLSRNTGASADEIVKDFEKMNDGVAKWAVEHNKAWNFITAPQYEYIKRLEDQGKAEEAQLVVGKATTDHFKSELAPELGTLQSLWKDVSDEASKAWDAMKGWGRSTAVEADIKAQIDRIAIAKADAAAARARMGDTNPNSPGYGQDEDMAREQLRFLKMQQAHADETVAINKQAEADAKAAISARQKLDAVLDQIDPQRRLNKELADTKKLIDDAAKGGTPISDADQKMLYADVRNRNTPAVQKDGYQEMLGIIQKHNLEMQIEADTQKKVSDADRWAIDAKAKLNSETMKLTDAERNASLAGIEASKAWERQNDAIRAQADEEKFLQDIIDRKGLANQGQGPTFEDAKQMSATHYLDGLKDQTKRADQYVSGVFGHMEDAIVQFAMTGKLSFKSLWSFMSEEYVRNLVQMGEQKFLTDAAGNFSLAGLTSAATSLGSFFGFGHANGLGYVPYNGYPAVLHEGERVLTRQEAQAGGSGQMLHFDYSGQTINVGQGVSRGEVVAAVRQGNAENEARIRRLLRNGNI